MSRTVLIVAGLVLALLGAFALWQGGVSYTDREEVLDIGPVEATAETEERISVPPLVGGLILATGVGLVVVGAARGEG